MKETTLRIIIGCLMGLVLIISLVGVMYFPLKSMADIIEECENRGWDGSEYNTGVMDVQLFRESKEIIVKCNKEKENDETDKIIEVLDAIPGIKLKGASSSE